MRIEVEGGGYVSAADEFYDANHGVIDLMGRLVSALDAGGGMAGNDTGGEQFAGQYDSAAAQLVQAGCDLGEAMGSLGNLLNASLVNHDGADHGALVQGGPTYSEPTGDTNPDHWTETLATPAPPSAQGGTGDQPGWWHWIASHVGGLLWPDADTGKLRTVGHAWQSAGSQLSAYSVNPEAAAGAISIERSPEVDDAVATCNEVAQHVTDLATGFTSIGQACLDYADQVDQHHQEIEDQLTSFLEWTAVIEGGGALLGIFTAGLGELAAQAGEGAEIANAAAKVVKVLDDLLELARLGAAKIGDLVESVGQIAVRVKKILSARIITALEKVGVTLGRVDLESLPAWATREAAIPESGPGADLYAGMTEADRYGGLTKQEFFDKYWNKEKGTWDWPPDNGFAGDPAPNGLNVGDTIDRFGPGDGGEYAANANDTYGQRAMPPSNIGREYHQYVVEKPLPATVEQGDIAPAFGQPGGGTQYYFGDHDISWYVDNGYLKEIK